MNRLDYFLRRLFLAIPTFLGITLVCFALTRLLPGGPVELQLLKAKGIGAGGESARTAAAAAVTEEYRQALAAQYGFDRPLARQYYDWLVKQVMGLKLTSYDHPDKTAFALIRDRIPVSLGFGLAAFVLTYLVSIPLGIAKALRNRTLFDAGSSVIVFAAYAMPSFALALALKLLLCGIDENFWSVFPTGGLMSDFDHEPSFSALVLDQVWHMALPVSIYVIGSFAMVTLMMKNSLLEQVSADYVRTVIAKGASRTRAIWAHALRNALVPVATGFGSMLSLLFAGSVIIENIFDIPGMGQLSWEALVARDYAVFMALISLMSVVQLAGNLLGDLLYVFIDPRIDFSRRP